MRLGVVFPQTEIGSDPAVVRDFAQAASQMPAGGAGPVNQSQQVF
jgi:hypothetical protein